MIYIDTETTGVGTSDEILSIAIVNDRGATLLNTYLQPETKTDWPNAERIHGISPKEVLSGIYPTLSEITPQIITIIRSNELKICSYNWEFDRMMLCQNPELANFINNSAIGHCAMNRYAIYKGHTSDKSYHSTGYKPHKLNAAAAEAGHIWTGQEHGALADAQAARHVWKWLESQQKKVVSKNAAEELFKEPITPEVFNDLFETASSVKNHPKKSLSRITKILIVNIKLKKLLDTGVITQEEYERYKTKLLNT